MKVLEVRGDLIADHAQTATGPSGPCSICQRPIRRHDRYAVLQSDGKRAHVPCIGRPTASRAAQ
jgi:hypothetical protein